MLNYTEEQLINLNKQGMEQLSKGLWKDATETFQELLTVDDNPVLRNNLALALFSRELCQDALDILRPILENDVMSPFSWALASMIALELEEETTAHEYLQKAIKQFDLGLRDLSKFEIEPKLWREYTVIIKQAAGFLEEDRLVLNLHKRWERLYQSKEDLFQVGVAFFNVGYPSRAITVWNRIASGEWSFLQGYIKTAEVIDQGLVPSFTLPYLPPQISRDREDGYNLEKLLSGNLRALFVAQLFDSSSPEEVLSPMIDALVSIEDDWGIAFGQAILEGNSFPTDWKVSAATALTNRGFFAEGQKISMMIDGESHTVVLKTHDLSPASAEQRARLEDVQDLLYQERYEEALEILEEDFEACVLPLEGFELLGKLYATLGNKEEAEGIVDIFLELAEGEDGEDFKEAYVVITDIYLRLDDLETASEYFAKIDYATLPQKLENSYARLQQWLED